MLKFLLWCILLVMCWPLALLALIAYPLVVEPNLRLIWQAWVWAVGYGLLVVLVGAAALQPLPLNWALAGASLVVGTLAGGVIAAAGRSGRLWVDGAQLRWDQGPPRGLPS